MIYIHRYYIYLYWCKQGVHALDHLWPSSALAESYYAG